MELLLLSIYSFFVWLIFFKFKWLPWNTVSQVIVVTIPVISIAALILILNVVAPSSDDVRVINYVVPVVPRVTGRVTEVMGEELVAIDDYVARRIDAVYVIYNEFKSAQA